MAVGDDDQSIFAFNGAELSNMLGFESMYPTAKTVVLTDNYRSTQSVLNAAESIISQADDRLVYRLPELTKKLKAVTEQSEGNIEHIKYPSREHQLNDIAKRIKQTWESDTNQSLAVLAHNHNSLKRISSFLQEAGVPIRYEQQNNILDQQLVQQVYILAELIDSISLGDTRHANYYLSTLLAYPAWKVDPKDLWKTATENFAKNSSWLDSLLNSSNKGMKSIAEWLLWLSMEAAGEPVPVMVEYLVGLREGKHMLSPLKEYYLSLRDIDSSYLESLSGLSVLQNLIFEFAATSSAGTPKLRDFVRFMRVNKELGRQVVDESWFVSSEKSVQLLTIHKAKGLEFDSVYLLDAIENDWEPRRFGRKPPANLPLQPYGEHFDDYVRLAYVAATRSRRSFIVSSYVNDEKGQKLLSSPIFETINLTELDYADEAKEEKIGLLEASLLWPRLETKNERALLQPKLDAYRLNATGLLQFLDVTNGGPLQFLERQLLKLPSITTDKMAFGTAMHAALQTAQNLINKEAFDLNEVKAAYQKSLESQQQPSATVERYLPHGIGVIDMLFNEFGFTLPKEGLAEVVLNHNELDGVPLSGTLDSAFLDGETLIISDYKTGSALTNFGTKDQTKAVKAWRHHSQLLFYCLLAQCSGRFKQAKKYRARMIYIESEDPDKLYLEIEPSLEELERLHKLITAVWKKISGYDLKDTSSYAEGIVGIRAFEEDLLQGK
jgi:ATP-dependent DNA helicase UvrD/PcrA